MKRSPRQADRVATLTVTGKGQVTLRKDVLQHLGVAAGEKLQVSKLPGGRLEVRAARSGASVESIFGLLADKTARGATLAEIAKAIEDGWAGRR